MKDQAPPPPVEITIERLVLHGFADHARVAAAVRRELARLSSPAVAVADTARTAVEGAVSRAAFGPPRGGGR